MNKKAQLLYTDKAPLSRNGKTRYIYLPLIELKNRHGIEIDPDNCFVSFFKVHAKRLIVEIESPNKI